MSRIGTSPITIPDGVTVTFKGHQAAVKGPKGELTQNFSPKVKLAQDANQVTVSRLSDDKPTRALHGLTRSLLANMVAGVTDGYQKVLLLEGTGYRVNQQGSKLVLSLGFSHPVEVETPEGISFAVEGNKQITISGIDKQLVGQTAAEIRALKKPEPYKGKGIRYQDEVVRRKPGKAAKVGAAGE